MNRLNNSVLILGGDGYLGWSVALALANRSDRQVVIVDNLLKRKLERQVNVQSLTELSPPEARVEAYKRLYKRDNLRYENIDLRNYESVLDLVKRYRPKIILNAAQQPSAPFSMMSPENARLTFDNNSTTNLTVLWAIRSVSTDIQYITLGSAGVYLSIDTDYIPKSKVDLSFSYQNENHRVLDTWLPMQASDIYHQSKVNSFLLNDLCTKLWGLKTITVQQSTIFGHSILENREEQYHDLSTRYNYDHIFGTVFNRFVCQAAVRHPITVYGHGNQTTGLISLADSVDSFLRLCDLPIDNGKHVIEHHYTQTLSINEMARRLSMVADIEIEYLENPRFEQDSILKKKFESSKSLESKRQNEISFINDVETMYNYVLKYKQNINRDFIQPNVNWCVHQENVRLVG